MTRLHRSVALIALTLLFSLPALAQNSTETTDPAITLHERIAEELRDNLSETGCKRLDERLATTVFNEQSILEMLQDDGMTEEAACEVVENNLSELLEEREYLFFVDKVRSAARMIIVQGKADQEIKKRIAAQETVQDKKVKNKLQEEASILTEDVARMKERIGSLVASFSDHHLDRLDDAISAAGVDSAHQAFVTEQLRTEYNFAKKIKTIQDILQSIDDIRKQTVIKEKALRKAKTEEQRDKLTEELTQMAGRLKRLESDYTIIVAGIDKNALHEKDKAKTFSWQDELKEIFSPIIVELKGLTDRPRRMESLRSDITYYDERIPEISKALAEIESLNSDPRSKPVAPRLEESYEYWTQLEKEFISKREALQHQLGELEKDKQPIGETVDSFFKSVIKHRGKNILIAGLAFLITFAIFHYLRILLMRVNPLKESPKYQFLTNLVDIVLHFFTFLISTGAMIVALYTTGDWLILGLVLIVIIGFLWAAKNTMAQFTEQTKLLLGFGPVRQGEKVQYEGVSYRVDSIGIFSYLKNPVLMGGAVRLPLKDLVYLRSRPYHEDEEWFLCETGDFLLLPGNRFRKVMEQTPEMVTLLNPVLNQEEFMPTSVFLEITPFTNLCIRPTYVGHTFHVGMKHRDEVLDSMVETLRQYAKRELAKHDFSKEIEDMVIAYDGVESPVPQGYGALGLRMVFQVKLPVEHADRYCQVRRLTQHIALMAANDHGWDLACVPDAEYPMEEQPVSQ